jgi:kumamolisin
MPSATLETSTDPDETYLDVEALAVAAPNLERTTAVFVPLDLSFPFSFDLFLYGALDPERLGGALPTVLSISDGECEPEFNGAQRRIAQHFLAAAAALGLTSVAASGDLGFLGCQEKTQAAGYPASSRWVTGVGGTDLTLDAQNRIANQTVWSTFGDGSGDTTGSGGGPSVDFGRPPWQTGPGIDAAIQPTGSDRLTPDVASMASFTPGIAVNGGAGGWTGGGGTSAATPLVAAMLALIAQQERAAGRPPLGSVNPLLYELARGSGYGTIFADVVEGTSSPRPDTPLGKSPAGGAAQPGYDLATGLGQPRGPALADAVAASAP